MALHRDIFWIGRQWAVTGFGMQAINQKHGGEFDIAIERLWDDDLLDAVRGQKWFNPDDFNKGLDLARARHPRPPPRPAAPPLPVETLLQQANAMDAAPQPPAPLKATAEPAPEPVKPPEPAPLFLEMRMPSHSGKLLRVWRARRQR
ncbi:hypothetical protein [Bradyrhizobium sp.]|uniref:hypothetical protein n=1 Tax=Bradyrhizobium sp. TaxID=376 RepID=UPI001D66F7C7|nr:hypothetical protein [Bradyrhizobium sp.]MBI5319730.1 hypothetical protein [Bradyrhizobium sp.]